MKEYDPMCRVWTPFVNHKGSLMLTQSLKMTYNLGNKIQKPNYIGIFIHTL